MESTAKYTIQAKIGQRRHRRKGHRGASKFGGELLETMVRSRLHVERTGSLAMNQWLRTFALTVVVAWTSGTARASDNVPASPPKTVTKSWHRWTGNEIIRDFLVQVEFDAKRSKKELADLEKLMKDSRKERENNPASDIFEMELRKKNEVVEVFERLEKDIRAFDRDLDDTTRQMQWADKR